MLPVNIILPEDAEQLALTLNGKKSNLGRKDFVKFAETSGIPIKSANAMLNKLVSLSNDFLMQCEQSNLSDELKLKTKELIGQRTDVIGLS